MPKMFVHAPSGVFTTQARARVAAELTNLGMACERRPEHDRYLGLRVPDAAAAQGRGHQGDLHGIRSAA